MRKDTDTSAEPSITFGQEARMGFEGMTQGLALIGPSASRRRALRSLLADAVSAGTGVVALTIGRDGALLDAGQTLVDAGGHPGTAFIVDTEAGPGRSHVLAPFHDLDADAMTRVLLGCAPALSGHGAAAGRAAHLLPCVLEALTQLRDEGLLALGASAILDHLELRHLIDLSNADFYPMLAEPRRKAIDGYLRALPGYVEHRKYMQPQAVFDAHSEAAALLADGLAWALRPRFAAIVARDEADVTLADLFAPGHLALLRCTALPGEASAGSFVAGCLVAMLAKRAPDAPPAILIVDGADSLPAWQLHDLSLLRAPGLGLVIGLAGNEASGDAAIRELAWKAVLPGAGSRALTILDMPDEVTVDLKGFLSRDRAVLGNGGQAGDAVLPDAVTDPARGLVQSRLKPVGNADAGDKAEPAVALSLRRFLDPAERDAVEGPEDDTLTDAARAFRDSGTTPQSGGLSVAMAQRRGNAEG